MNFQNFLVGLMVKIQNEEYKKMAQGVAEGDPKFYTMKSKPRKGLSKTFHFITLGLIISTFAIMLPNLSTRYVNNIKIRKESLHHPEASKTPQQRWEEKKLEFLEE